MDLPQAPCHFHTELLQFLKDVENRTFNEFVVRGIPSKESQTNIRFPEEHFPLTQNRHHITHIVVKCVTQ